MAGTPVRVRQQAGSGRNSALLAASTLAARPSPGKAMAAIAPDAWPVESVAPVLKRKGRSGKEKGVALPPPFETADAAYSDIFRPCSGCTGRLLGPCMVAWKALSCSSVIDIGCFRTIHLTPSVQGGVVREPSKA